jgi:16S rRNA (adenine1518-N6/adenine1519-N6)-dimethyltransferase
VRHVQTKTEIEAALAAVGMRPRKKFGQHFLIDGNLMRKLVDQAGIQPGDLVLEVGPGTGGLTDLLAETGACVNCVEIDRDLHALLVDRFAQFARVRIWLGDILDGKHRLRNDIARLLSQAMPERTLVKLIANLPYQIATPLVVNLILDYPQVRRLCFTVQAEVGDRIISAPNSRDYGPLSILCQLLCEIETIARLPPACFWPRPAVDSVMIRMDVRDTLALKRGQLHAFVQFVRGVFAHRRKTLRSALTYVVDASTRDAICGQFDGQHRPERFTVDEWTAMFQHACSRD